MHVFTEWATTAIGLFTSQIVLRDLLNGSTWLWIGGAENSWGGDEKVGIRETSGKRH